MVELGQLEKQHEEFAKRHVQVVAISNDNQPNARKTQARFPNLVIVADTDQNMAKAVQVIHPGAGPNLEDTNAPTTFLVDGTGTVRWYAQPERFIERLTPEDLLAAIDQKGAK